MASLKIKQKNKRFDPQYSYYHQVMVNKYIRLGYSKRIAFNKARKEFFESLKTYTWDQY